ncbi:MAG: hypothetical protein ABR587_15095 [Candidatus Binatia bacterium]
MKKVTLSIATVALVGFYAGAASAACDFDIVKAKGVKGSMVRSYAACPSTENPASNTATDGGTEACTPVTPRQIEGQGTLYNFSSKGGCTVQTQAKLVSDCSEVEDANGTPLGLDVGACHITFVKAKCKGIQQSDEATPIDSPDDIGWSLATLSRATLADDGNGDMTVIDFPVTFGFDQPKKGGIKLKGNSAEELKAIVGANNADLPECTSIEIVDVIIKDPAGLPFARLGGATLPQ